MNADNTNNITPNPTILPAEELNTSQGGNTCNTGEEYAQSCVCDNDPSCDFCHWGDNHLRGFAAKDADVATTNSTPMTTWPTFLATIR